MPNNPLNGTAYRRPLVVTFGYKMKRRVPILMLALAIAGCSDTVRTEFKTLDDAKQAKAFERGWLPPVLPDGSTDIVEENDLDINSGTGSFRFPTESTSHFLETIGSEHGGIVTRSSLGIAIAVTNKDTRWSIKLDPQKGTGTYSVQYKKK